MLVKGGEECSRNRSRMLVRILRTRTLFRSPNLRRLMLQRQRCSESTSRAALEDENACQLQRTQECEHVRSPNAVGILELRCILHFSVAPHNSHPGTPIAAVWALGIAVDALKSDARDERAVLADRISRGVSKLPHQTHTSPARTSATLDANV